jgi:hypothetical protein
MPCYLDTLTEKNAQTHEHLSFEVLEKMGIPDTDIMAWAMLKEPCSLLSKSEFAYTGTPPSMYMVCPLI